MSRSGFRESVRGGRCRVVDAKTAVLTSVALVAFAGNSLLTRSALDPPQIDAAAFTAVRLVAGALVLAIIARARSGGWHFLRPGDAIGPLALFAYAAPFSLAYLRIGAALGALVLFATVQLTMIGYGLAHGARPALRAWTGIALVRPTASGSDPLGVLLMIVAGIAWGIYSVAGRRSADPIGTNAYSFVWSSFPAVGIALAAGPSDPTVGGVALALVSGAVTSGGGYAIWYGALRGLTVTQAAVAQLSVPVIAAAGAVLLLGEQLTPRLMLCGAAVLAGVGLVLSSRRA
jgi:drug/metabolite transporter (DMT)-like permease